MEDPTNRKAAWPAVYFIREDLKNEKMGLIEDMRELSLNYWGGTDPIIDTMIKEVSDRIEEINRILQAISVGSYEAPEE